MAISTTMSARDWGLLALLSLIWGGSFLYVGIAVRELPPLTVVTTRVGLAALALGVVMVLGARAWPRGRIWRDFALLAVINNVVPFLLIAWAQTRIPSGLASILNATTPLFGVVVAGLVLADEPFSLRRLIGVGIGVAGVAWVIGPDALTGLGADPTAQGACLAAALLYACSGVYARRLKGYGADRIAVAAAPLGIAALLLAPVMVAIDAPWRLPAPSGAAIAALLALALVSTALAYLLYYRLLDRVGATNILLVTLLVPVTAILMGALVLGERLEGQDAVGMALIALGLSVIDGRVWRGVGRRFSRTPAA